MAERKTVVCEHRQASQMPRHLISDAHEWINEIPTVLGLFGSRITLTAWREDDQTVAFRGSKSRNKVSVGEPAEGSLSSLRTCSQSEITSRDLVLAASACLLLPVTSVGRLPLVWWRALIGGPWPRYLPFRYGRSGVGGRPCRG